MRNRLGAAIFVLGLAAVTAPAAGQEHGDHAAGEELGVVEFPTTCNAEAQVQFERGVALLHSFWWAEAGRAFDAVIAGDGDCAMAYWGKAMVARGNWFAGAPSPPAIEAGLAAVERGLAVGSASPREMEYLEAAATLFRGSAAGDYRGAALEYEESMRAVAAAHPEDREATIFYAMAVAANATPGDTAFVRQRRAGALLEPVFAEAPNHPGVAHYIVHTYDSPPIAHMGIEAARRYGSIAPAVPHARHMPSHIFTRLGLWDESIEANIASAAAARDYEIAEGSAEVSFDRAHAWDYLAYAYLQQGRDVAAAELVAEVLSSRAAPSIATGYAFAAIPARYALERGRWADAAALEVRPTPGFLAGEAITHFARGIGAARSGRMDAANAAVIALAGLRDGIRSRGDTYWADVVEAQRLSVSAWVAHEGGDDTAALALISEAAALEERIDKHPVTPGPILPARELQGDLLMELGRSGDALSAYRAVLAREPRRARSVAAAARAAEASGDTAAARVYHAQLIEIMARADTERPELRAARAFLGG